MRRLYRTIRLLFLLGVVLIGSIPHHKAWAIEVPPAGALTYLQTNGPTAGLGLGDWYTNTNNGQAPNPGAPGGYHYVEITVPCGWPTNTPLYMDLYSPEINTDTTIAANALFDEINAAANNTIFELYPPGTVIGPATNVPAPDTGIPGSKQTYIPDSVAANYWVRYYTFPTPIVCGTYVLRAETQGNDQNGWRLRVGTDDDANPNTTPLANYDNPDGIVGTNDELIVGLRQVSYQHDVANLAQNLDNPDQCLTLYEYVAPGLLQVAFHNFDMDYPNPGGDLRIRTRYYAPSDVYDPLGKTGGTAGIASEKTVWNSGTATDRNTGDVILNPESGWWKVVSCITDHNQYIQEAQNGVSSFYQQPPTPQMTIAKDDGQTVVTLQQTLTYVISYANTSTGPTAGAATNVVIQDTIPTNTTYVSCTIDAPATGACSFANGIVTYTLNGAVNAGASGSVRSTVQVNANASGTVVNTVTLDYKDTLGNPFPRKTATDTDTIDPTAITLSSFTATSTAQGIMLQWATGLEINTLGFRLYRGTGNNRDTAQLITPQLILARGGSTGAAYSWLDKSADPNRRYSYWLEELDLRGTSASYGPARLNGIVGENLLFVPMIGR